MVWCQEGDKAISVGYDLRGRYELAITQSERVVGFGFDHPGQTGWALTLTNPGSNIAQGVLEMTTYCAVG